MVKPSARSVKWPDRRDLLTFGGVVMTGAAIGPARTAVATDRGIRADGFPRVRQIEAGDLNVGFVDLGPREAPAVLLLHGWPYDIHSFADVGPRLAATGYRVIIPHLRGFGSTRFLAPSSPRGGQQSVFAVDAMALMDALGVGTFLVGGFDWGARAACIIAALWPERCRGLVSVSGYLIGNPAAGARPLSPEAEMGWWYQFYFATERGRLGYDRNRKAFANLIWRTASPQWRFGDSEFERSAAALDNPDHVSVVIDNYRWRMGLSAGEARYDAHERRLAEAPDIAVPTVTLEGDANGAPHPDAATYASKFTGPYFHRVIVGGVGHNLPQEAPEAFSLAVRQVDALSLRA